MSMYKGLVLRSTGSWYDVKMDDGRVLKCRLRGKFKIKGLKVTNPLAVGDFVKFEIEEKNDQESGVIKEILPRENYLIRQSTRKAHHVHIIAANLDQAVLVATLVMPRTSFGFIDRFLVSAEAYHISTVIAFNKTDLLEEEDLEYQRDVMKMYEGIGYECIEISAETGYNIDAFEALLKGKKTLLSGHSGVGKSTLINRIAPEIEQRTNEISAFANKGMHTTTFAEMFEIEDDTYIIDTPGIKELGLVHIEPEELAGLFPEMRDMTGECRFYNCKHDKEPGCVVKQAVKEGRIAIPRYESYLSMLNGEDNRK
ncbi:ribosome biogenesis GTPase [Aureibacter tunicatorum]|uniref:Small ribosomal subunit biogenesis GTPase RsgA n=2 Tax=Aureibacter tunicatorum TaxID=866807 RepID=A0AAE3XLC2_9BACT|nr:ribosome biogenesis GTPase [Aureibacter tunicatorum]BDD03083.1 putative ribosome biogenesis GTPase RsgA [Aureibacter tunicatorum]